MRSDRSDSGLYPPDRLARAATAAGEAGLAALLLTPGPDLRYLTGYDAQQLERLTCLVVPAAGGRGPGGGGPGEREPGGGGPGERSRAGAARASGGPAGAGRAGPDSRSWSCRGWNCPPPRPHPRAGWGSR